MSIFDKKIHRENTSSIKYDGLQRYFGKEGVKPLWVADMDFQTPKFIKEAIIKRAEHQIYGYQNLDDDFYHSIITWQKKRNNWKIEKEWINFVPGVVPALSCCVEAFSNEEDEVIIQTPVYHPFYAVIKEQNRKIVKNPLKETDGKYQMDFEDLRSKISDKTRMLILCSPHNPVGKVWSRQDLKTLGDICIENNIVLLSDEIHSDLVFKKFTPIAKVSKEIANITVTLNAPSKTFNLAGLNTAYSIIKNVALKEKLENVLKKRSLTIAGNFGVTSLVSAYRDGEKWLKDLLDYLQKNFKLARKELKNTKIRVFKPEGTYLMWLDFREYNLPQKEIERRLLDSCKIALNNGVTFGREGNGFFRLNVALPQSELKKALKKLSKEFKI